MGGLGGAFALCINNPFLGISFRKYLEGIEFLSHEYRNSINPRPLDRHLPHQAGCFLKIAFNPKWILSRDKQKVSYYTTIQAMFLETPDLQKIFKCSTLEFFWG